jgi:hypothetical protein
LLWATSKTNKPQTPLGFGLLRSRVVCWLLKHARAVVDEDEEAASSNRASYEARHTPRAAAVARTARGDCSQPGSDSAAQRRSRAIRLAVRLVRETAPKGARMFTANEMTPTCKAQSSQLAPSLAARHLQGAHEVRRSRERAPRDHQRWHAVPNTVSSTSLFGMTWLVLSTKHLSCRRS